MNNWKNPKTELPEDRGEPYQVIAAQKKLMGGVYEGTHRRIFTQDWHIRLWPENFVSWQYDCVGVVFADAEWSLNED